ncbi:MAG: (2Fe-2S) ferredoxin domain-containing protein [Erysipelotrichaceae bacterium]|nr:(2Fe-2S) ferredoxin domain-containing protein [Erysipelotrichaceae bacterium]
MVNVEICIGSSCYVKGSDKVVAIVKNLISEQGWEDKVTVKGSFCIQSCQNKYGLGIKVNEQTIKGVTLSNAKEIIKDAIGNAL